MAIELTDRQFELGNMKIGVLQDYAFSSSIRATGVIDVAEKNHVSVSAYAGGYVKRINLLPGERVVKGQTLFVLENPDFVQMQQDYLESKAQLTFLKSDYERQKNLVEDNIASQKNFLKAESDYQTTLIKIEGLKKRMALLGLAADKISVDKLVSTIAVSTPVSGYIVEVNAMRGMFLNPTDVAVELINTDHMHLELDVFEKDILQIKKGQQIRFKMPDASSELFEAEVYLIGKEVEGDNRVVRVHGHLEDIKDDIDFVPGMFLEAEIITASQSTMGLPESAVVEVDDRWFVLIEKEKTGTTHHFEKKEVQIGWIENGKVQILNADTFEPGQGILIEGAFNLINE